MHRNLALAASALVACAAVYAVAVGLTPPEAEAGPTGGFRPGMVIRKPGVYVVPRGWFVPDMDSDQSGMAIEAPNVVIDLNGQTFGIGGATGTHITLGPNAARVTIRNGRLQGGATAIGGISGGDVNLDGLELLGQAGDAISCIDWSGSITVENSAIRDAGGNGVLVALGDVNGDGSFSMQDCAISRVGGNGVTVTANASSNMELELIHFGFDRVVVRHCGAAGLDISGAARARVDRCTVSDCGGDGIRADDSADVGIDHSDVARVAGNGMRFFVGTANGGVWRTSVTDCGIANALSGHGIVIFGQGGNDTIEVELSRNRISRTGRSGVLLSGDAGTRGRGRIEANTIADVGLAQNPAGPEDRAGVYEKIEGIFIIGRNHVSGGSGAQSVGLFAGVDVSTVEANSVSGFGTGIEITGDDNHLERNVVAGNFIGTNIVGRGNVLARNVISGNSGVAIDLTSAIHSRVEANQVTRNPGGVNAGAASNFLISNTLLGNGAVTGGTVGPTNVIVP